MKIGYAFLTLKGKLPSTPEKPVDYLCCGQFISPQMAPESCPRIYFELPITRPVSAVLWHAPLGKGSFFNRAILFPWDKFEMVDVNQDGPGGLGERVPKFTLANENPPREMSLALGYVMKFWQPLTSLAAASKLLPFLLKMSQVQKEDFLGRIGQSRNREKFRVLLENTAIALSWPAWEKRGLPYEERIRDMGAHGSPITMAVFRKRVNRDMKLEKRPRH